jgi:hypothetical protein
MGLELKTINVSYTDNLENIFAIELYKLLKNYVNIKVITEYYSSVDYLITDKNDINNKMYLELKSRQISKNSFDTFFIGFNKILKINECYKPTILVWNFTDGLYFCKCKTKFNNYKTSIIQNSKVIEIDKNDCLSGMDKLTDKILNILKIKKPLNNQNNQIIDISNQQLDISNQNLDK